MPRLKELLRFVGGPYDGQAGTLDVCSCNLDHEHELRFGACFYGYNLSAPRRKGKVEARFLEEQACSECGRACDELPDGARFAFWEEDVCLVCAMERLSPEQIERLRALLRERLL